MATPGVIGPFPPYVADDDAARDEFDRKRRRVLWTMPSGLYIIGSRHDGRRNGMVLNWATQVAFQPKLIGIGVEKSALTHELISASALFSLMTVARADRAIIRKFTKPVEVDETAMTLNGFPFHDGITGVPVLDQAPAVLECEVRDTVDIGEHSFFIGETVDARFQLDEDTEVLRMEDTRLNYGG